MISYTLKNKVEIKSCKTDGNYNNNKINKRWHGQQWLKVKTKQNLQGGAKQNETLHFQSKHVSN